LTTFSVSMLCRLSNGSAVSAPGAIEKFRVSSSGAASEDATPICAV